MVGRPKGLPKTGGRKPGSTNLKIAPKDARMIAAAEALRREMEDHRPPPGTELAKEILGKFAHNCAAVTMKLMPIWQENGEPIWRFKGHEELWFKMVTLTREYARDASPYQSPTFRAVIVTPPPETKTGEGARVINLTVFEGGHAVTTTEIIEDKAG